MKRLVSLILALSIISVTLSGCRKKAEEAPAETNGGPGYSVTNGSNPYMPAQTNSVPDPLSTLTPQQMAAMQIGTPDDTLEGEGAPIGTAVPADELFAAIDPAPGSATVTLAPVVTDYQSAGIINPMSYQYAAVMDDALDYTFNYPLHWEHVPGIYTVCYREKVEKGDFPARISICRKKLVHTPDDIMMMEQLTSYLKMVSEQYDQKTFQIGTPDKELRFMGHKGALANTYLAFWGNIEVKGYVVGVAINRTLYVFHFCATYADYNAMNGVREYIINSVALKDEKKK